MDGTSAGAQSFACEMFTRAWHGDQFAREWFQRHFSGILLNWLNRHPRKEAACRLYNEEDYVSRTFHSVWHCSLDGLQVEFTTLTTVIQYLFAHLNGHIMDALRASTALEEGHALTGEKSRADQAETEKLWKSIQGVFSNERELRLAHLLYNCALKPRDIMQRFPQEFSDPREISQVRHAVMRFIRTAYV